MCTYTVDSTWELANNNEIHDMHDFKMLLLKIQKFILINYLQET